MARRNYPKMLRLVANTFGVSEYDAKRLDLAAKYIEKMERQAADVQNKVRKLELERDRLVTAHRYVVERFRNAQKASKSLEAVSGRWGVWGNVPANKRYDTQRALFVAQQAKHQAIAAVEAMLKRDYGYVNIEPDKSDQHDGGAESSTLP